MLTLIKEMSMASIIATAGQNSLFSKLWLRCLSVQALIPLGGGFCSPNYSSASEVCGSLLAGERPRRDFEEINDIMQ